MDRLDQKLLVDLNTAKESLLQVASQRPDWTAFELKKQARGRESASIMGLALYALLEEGKLIRTPNYRVRLAQS